MLLSFINVIVHPQTLRKSLRSLLALRLRSETHNTPKTQSMRFSNTIFAENYLSDIQNPRSVIKQERP